MRVGGPTAILVSVTRFVQAGIIMSDLHFVPLGVGDAFSAKYYSSSILVESRGFRLLVDCPHPIRKMLSENTGKAPIGNVDVADIDAVLLTHLHADHCSGLEGLIYFNHYRLGRKTRLYMHPIVREHLFDGCLGSGMDRARDDASAPVIELVDLSFDHPVAVGPFEVACRQTVHSRPTTAFRLHTSHRSLAVSADTSFDRGLIDWLAQADRFIHETNLPPHTPYFELAKLPEEVRNKMWLIHYPDDFSQEQSQIELLRQGQVYEV